MGIQTIAARTQPPVIGIIRLGIRKETDRGTEYPANTNYFVLHDAPQVMEVYGKEPQELDILFPSDDLEASVPTWLKWYGAGVRGKDGKVVGGKLKCVGNGPGADGKPGEAKHYDKTDATTGVVPMRACLGEQCPDWNDGKSNRQCKPSMTVYVMLPKVSPFGVFAINTTSWNSIRSFYDQLQWIKNLNQGKIALIPFKLVKQEHKVKFHDKKTGKEESKIQWIMRLKPNENKQEIAALAETLGRLHQARLTWTAPAPELISAGIEDGYAAIDTESVEIQAQTEQKRATAEQIAQDPEVVAAFSRMEGALGRALTPKDKLILVRKKEAEPNIKEAVLTAIENAIVSAAKPKAAAATAQAPGQVQDVAVIPSHPEADGIL